VADGVVWVGVGVATWAFGVLVALGFAVGVGAPLLGLGVAEGEATGSGVLVGIGEMKIILMPCSGIGEMVFLFVVKNAAAVPTKMRKTMMTIIGPFFAPSCCITRQSYYTFETM